MNPRSAKAKGGRFVRYLVEKMRLQLDSKAYAVLGSGAGEEKGDVYLPNRLITIEAKNAEQINLLMWWEQAKRETLGDNLCALILRNPKKPEFQESLVVIDLEDFIRLVAGKTEKMEITATPSKELEWALTGLKQAINKVIKFIE